MAQQGSSRQSNHTVITVVVLVLIALGFFVASFFALPT